MLSGLNRFGIRGQLELLKLYLVVPGHLTDSGVVISRMETQPGKSTNRSTVQKEQQFGTPNESSSGRTYLSVDTPFSEANSQMQH